MNKKEIGYESEYIKLSVITVVSNFGFNGLTLINSLNGSTAFGFNSGKFFNIFLYIINKCGIT